jgi:pyrimidine deaminase RibD-like protein
MTRPLRIAHKVAKTSRHRQHKMAAVVVQGGKVLASAANMGTGRGHAEARALRPHRDFEGADIYIVRLNGRGTSKPCPECARMIQEAKIARVIYTDKDGVIQTCKPSELPTNYAT